jgi:hypothetical protein
MPPGTQTLFLRWLAAKRSRASPPVLDQPPKQPRRKLSKAELREQAAAAFLAWREGQTVKDK